MKRLMWAGLIAAALLGTRLAAQKPQAAETLLQTAIKKEVVDGDLKAAIEQYKNVVQSGNRALAARALVRMAECYQKLGDAQSRQVYERIVRDYADQKEAVTMARARLGTGNGADSLAKRLLCTECGDYEATMTIDGRFVAFTDWDSGDIAIRDMATGQVKHLMAKTGTFKDSPAFVEEPVLSPDLRQVAYLWHTRRGNPEVHQLRIMPNEPGATPRVLVESSPDTYEPVGWSPDGKSILANVGKADRTSQLAWVSAADGAVKTIKSQIRFTGAKTIDPKVSPDGKYIAYAAVPSSLSEPSAATSNPQNVHVYVLAADGSSETEVVKTTGINRSPVWTPDGKHLLFLSDIAGTLSLWSIAVENGKAAGVPSLVSPSLGNGVWPIGVTRAGTLMYVLDQSGVEQISIAEMDSAGGKLLGRARAGESFVGIAPSWSPDGKSIAFKRHHPGSETAYDLVVHSLETGDEKTFPTALGFTGPGQPLWLSDGKAILTGLAGSQPANSGSYRVDLASGEWKQQPSPQGGTSIVRRDTGLVAIDATTGTEKLVVAFSPRDPLAVVRSPDGRTLALWRSYPQTNKTVLGTVGVDGNNYRELYTSSLVPASRLRNLAWSRDGSSILFVTPRGDNWGIMRIPAQGGTPEFTGIEFKDTIQGMDISPDGSRLAYSAAKGAEELWSLDNVLSAIK